MQMITGTIFENEFDTEWRNDLPYTHVLKPAEYPVRCHLSSGLRLGLAEILGLEARISGESALVLLRYQRRNPGMQLGERLKPGKGIASPRIVLQSGHGKRLAASAWVAKQPCFPKFGACAIVSPTQEPLPSLL